MTFKFEKQGNICVWKGDPDCNAAYEALRRHLLDSGRPTLPPASELSNTQLGNLGEAVAFLTGKAGPHAHPSHRVLSDNCRNPLVGGSKTGLDILWLAFDEVDEARDHAWIQEVKLTADKRSASYVSSVLADCEKLFGITAGMSLEERLGDAAFKLEHFALEPELARRTRALGARSAAEVTRVTLKPTGVHDLQVDALSVIETVRVTLIASHGWPAERVEPHLISLSDLGQRLKSLVAAA